MTPVLLSTRFISRKESWRDPRITNDNCRETIEEAFTDRNNLVKLEIQVT